MGKRRYAVVCGNGTNIVAVLEEGAQVADLRSETEEQLCRILGRDVGKDIFGLRGELAGLEVVLDQEQILDDVFPVTPVQVKVIWKGDAGTNTGKGLGGNGEKPDNDHPSYPALGAFRFELTQDAFDVFDTRGKGKIPLDDVKKRFVPGSHPKVRAGKWNHEDAVEDLVATMGGGPQVSKDQWIDYHLKLSKITEEDDAYGMLLRTNWNVDFIPKSEVLDLLRLIKDKGERTGKGKKSALRRFRFYDINDSRKMTISQFSNAMNSFAPGLSELQIKTLFDLFDPDGDGETDYRKLVDVAFARGGPKL